MKKIRAVVRGGRLVDRAMMDARLARLEAASQK